MQQIISFSKLLHVPTDAELLKEYEEIVARFDKWEEIPSLCVDFSETNMKQYTFYRIVNKFLNQSLDPLKLNLSSLEELTFNLQSTLVRTADFLSAFLFCTKLKVIELHSCDEILAKNAFTFSKTFRQIDRLTCDSFFTKKGDSYYVESSFLSEDLSAFIGIEESIIQVNLTLQFDTLQKSLELMNQFSKLKILAINIPSSYERDPILEIKSILECLYELSALQSVFIISHQANHLLPINRKHFRNPLKLIITYSSIMNKVPIADILEQAGESTEETDELNVLPYVQFKNNLLNLNFSSANLNTNDLEGIAEFLSKLRISIKFMEIKFCDLQRIPTFIWVKLINSIAKQKNLKLVRIQGGTKQGSVVALSIAKLMTCGIQEIFILGQKLEKQQLSIEINQLSDYSLTVLLDNVFHSSSIELKGIKVFAKLIVGSFRPFCDYFQKARYHLNQFIVKIEKSLTDTRFLVQNIIQNRIILLKQLDQLHISQTESVEFK